MFYGNTFNYYSCFLSNLYLIQLHSPKPIFSTLLLS